MSTIDTTIPAKPTGAAAILAASHSADHALKLYGGWFCPFVQRVWMLLCEKGIEYQYIEINPYKKAPEFVALNPRGLVPTLAVPVGDDGADGKGREVKALYESTIVCEFLDEEFADEAKYGPRLLPGTTYERARCRLWVEHVGSRIVPAFYRLLQHTDEKAYSLEDARGQLHEGIKTLTGEMMDNDTAGGGPWFLGERFGMVDLALAPWARRLGVVDHYKEGGCGFPKDGEGGEDEKVWARWRTWLQAVLERESLKQTSSEEEMYLAVYKRYAEDTTSSLVAKATRKGERLP